MPLRDIKKSPNEYLRLIWEALLGEPTLWRATAANPGIGYQSGDYLREVVNIASGGSSWFLNGRPISPPPSSERELASATGSSSDQSIGAPIPGASIVIAAPQYGDTSDGIVDGVWHPALGSPLFSSNPLDINAIPEEAQSLMMLCYLPKLVRNGNTIEAWDLKNIAAYARMDGSAPSLDIEGQIKGVPIGGLWAKTWIGRDWAEQTIAESRWRPSPGQAPPYPNNRLISEVTFFRQSIPSPIFEPSLVGPLVTAESTTATPTLAATSAIAPTVTAATQTTLQVEAKNADGSPMVGASVDFEIEAGGGELDVPAAATLAAASVVSPSVTAGEGTELQVEARNADGSPMVGASVAFEIEAGGGELDADPAAVAVAVSETVQLQAQFRNASGQIAQNTQVEFEIKSGGGDLT